MKIIKKGQDIKYHNYYKHKCRYCRTKFIYDKYKDLFIDFNNCECIYCPNCEKKETIWLDRKISKKEYKKLFED